MLTQNRYLECLPSLYSNTTFVFIDTQTAWEFLSGYNRDGDTERLGRRSTGRATRLPQDHPHPAPLDFGT